MTYAIIQMGGKQYRVQKGDSVLVDRVPEKEGAKVSPPVLLYGGDGDAVFEGAELGRVKIDAVVTEHLKGEKIRVFKYRPKKRYRKTQGYRSHLSRIEIRDIKPPSAAKPAAESGAGSSKRAAGSEKQPAAGSARSRSQAKDNDQEGTE